MTPSPLSIECLSFSYPALAGEGQGGFAPPLFAGLSLEVAAGETCILLGPADCGKTTLARLLAGLVPRYTGGSRTGAIRLGEVDVCASRPWELLELIGLVFQDSDAQVLTTRCDTEVAFALESLGLPREEMSRRIDESLALVGLAQFRLRNPATLSGGEKKRLLAACLLAIDPSAWVLDESLEELDAEWKARLLGIVGARGATRVILDSRWTPTLQDVPGTFALLAHATIVEASGPAPSRGLLSALAAEGLGPQGGGKALDLPRFPRAPFLKAEGVRFSFPGFGAFALQVDCLEIERGSVCALVGPNGSGKSTLGRVLCGLAVPQAGSILLDDGAGWKAASRGELNSRVGYLFQNPDHQIYLPTVREELALGLKNRGLSRTRVDELVEDAIGRFRLPGPRAAPALMSFGMRRMLQAAVYWLLDRDMLILDEMDSGLSTRDIAAVMRELCSRAACVVLITHDGQFARAAADRIVTLGDGRVVGDARVEGSP